MMFRFTALLLMFGCHGRFKKAAPHIDAVRVQMIQVGGPTARMGHSGSEGIVGLVEGVVQASRGMSAAKRIATAVDVEEVNEAFVAGLSDQLQGSPFAVGKGRKLPLLQIELLSYGLDASNMGQSGAFFSTLRFRIYEEDGRRVYKSSTECQVGFTDSSVFSEVIGTVDNLRQINNLTDSQIQRIFEAGAEACAAVVVSKMRRHAG